MANRTVDTAQATLGDGGSGLQYSLSGLVEVDDGLPEIVLGLYQTLMFGLFMVMIAESIGTVVLS